MILNHYEQLRKRKTWKSICLNCGNKFRVKTPDNKEEIDALLNATFLQYWMLEKEYLLSLQELIDKYPETKHPFKLKILMEKQVPVEDKAFGKELKKLNKKYFQDSDRDFYLPARLKIALSELEKYQQLTSGNYIKCNSCGQGKLSIQYKQWFK